MENNHRNSLEEGMNNYSSKIDEENDYNHLHSDEKFDFICSKIEDIELKKKASRFGKDHCRSEEQLLDQRAKKVLVKLFNTKIINEIKNCIYIGKRTSIYIGIRGEKAPEEWPEQFAIKIYKFYKPPENEFRNLTRYKKHNIPVPSPLYSKDNVVLLELISKDGQPAYPLLEVDRDLIEYEEIYKQVLINMRNSYQRCGLVHCNLSEFNIIVNDKKVFFVDVRQAVNNSNVNSTIYLRKDIASITKYFQSVGVKTAPMLQTYEFIVEPKLSSDVNQVIDEIIQNQEEMSINEFTKVFIPQCLNQVNNPEIEVMEIEKKNYSNSLLHVKNEKLLCDYTKESNEKDMDDEEKLNNKDNNKKQKTVWEKSNPGNILLASINRKEYSKVEWKSIHKLIKEATREKRKQRVALELKKKEESKVNIQTE